MKKRKILSAILSSALLVTVFSNLNYQAEAAVSPSGHVTQRGILKGGEIDINKFITFDLPAPINGAPKEKVQLIQESLDVNKLGMHNILYTSTNMQGDTSIKSFDLTVFDAPALWGSDVWGKPGSNKPDTPPQLHGVQSMTFPKGDTYESAIAAVTATDTDDGDLTDKIIIKGLERFDEFESGPYPITFTITDSFGNTTSQNVIYYVLD